MFWEFISVFIRAFRITNLRKRFWNNKFKKRFWRFIYIREFRITKFWRHVEDLFNLLHNLRRNFEDLLVKRIFLRCNHKFSFYKNSPKHLKVKRITIVFRDFDVELSLCSKGKENPNSDSWLSCGVELVFMAQQQTIKRSLDRLLYFSDLSFISSKAIYQFLFPLSYSLLCPSI